jgi:hypothetical protein
MALTQDDDGFAARLGHAAAQTGISAWAVVPDPGWTER